MHPHSPSFTSPKTSPAIPLPPEDKEKEKKLNDNEPAGENTDSKKLGHAAYLNPANQRGRAQRLMQPFSHKGNTKSEASPQLGTDAAHGTELGITSQLSALTFISKSESMPVAQPDHAIQQLLDQLRRTGYEDTDRCDTAARIVGIELCGVDRLPWLDSDFSSLAQALRQHQSPRLKSVYRVGLGSIGHTMSILRVGDQAIVLQSWLGCYSLQDWIAGDKSVLSDNVWLPQNGPYAVSDIVDMLSRLSERLKDNPGSAFSEEVRQLCSPHLRQQPAVDACIEKTKSAGKGLRCQWSHALTWDSEPFDDSHLPALPSAAAEMLERLQPGASTWSRDDKGRTPLLRFLHEKRINEVLPLIEHLPVEHLQQADLEGNTALHMATAQRSVTLIDALNRKACNWRAFNNQGESPAHALLAPRLWLRMTSDEVDTLVQQMIDGNANLDAKETEQGHGLLMRLVDHQHDAGLLARLIEAGADVDIQDEFDTTALMRAANDGNVDAVQVLLDKGANTTLQDKDGLTASDYALHAGHMDLAELINKKTTSD